MSEIKNVNKSGCPSVPSPFPWHPLGDPRPMRVAVSHHSGFKFSPMPSADFFCVQGLQPYTKAHKRIRQVEATKLVEAFLEAFLYKGPSLWAKSLLSTIGHFDATLADDKSTSLLNSHSIFTLYQCPYRLWGTDYFFSMFACLDMMPN